jgi:hypothetical protein
VLTASRVIMTVTATRHTIRKISTCIRGFAANTGKSNR